MAKRKKNNPLFRAEKLKPTKTEELITLHATAFKIGKVVVPGLAYKRGLGSIPLDAQFLKQAVAKCIPSQNCDVIIKGFRYPKSAEAEFQRDLTIIDNLEHEALPLITDMCLQVLAVQGTITTQKESN
jgi:hypothetical protein